jgi:hypothetical protein
VKAMMAVFFDIRGIVMIECVPEGQTVDQKYHLKVLTMQMPELWKKKSWILHQENVPAHNFLVVKQFFAGKCIPLLELLPVHRI